MNNLPPVLNRKPGATRTGLICTALLAATAFTAQAQNTGFGTVTPASKVTIKGNFAVGSGVYTSTPAPANGAIIQGLTGIGTVSPLCPLHVASTVPQALSADNTTGILFDNTYIRGFDPNNDIVPVYYGPGSYAWADTVSIYGEGSVVSGYMMRAPFFMANTDVSVVSDSRLKNVTRVSDASQDLVTLNRISITDYTMKDKFMVGDRKFKKVIAQEVEKVFPQAVNKSVGAVPDVMVAGDVVAEGDALKITLAKATDLKAGERVEFRNQRNTPETAAIRSVEGNVITVSLKQVKAGEKVFVYGREVKDLRSVDYEAIAMLNVSATQELSRKVAALETENAELRKISIEMKELKALVAALEGKANGTVTVSLTK